MWLGQRVDGERASLDSNRLTRHSVVFGSTGSGKTGLCVCLLEELALAGIPVLAIDPKGDLANLALGPADPAGERSAELSQATQVIVHTPGSTSGVPIDVLAGLSAPTGQPDAASELAAGAVSALLDLVGIRADRLKDPRHIVLTQILESAWAEDRDVELEWLILKLIDPPFDKVGVFPLDAFFPRDDRMGLAMQLNGLVASSGFATWREGDPLDFDRLLAPVGGKAPLRVFFLAHLDDAQRQFFTAMFLHRLVAWSRRQTGTDDLRALLYVDEAFGFCPPLPKRPATREPILKLVKQARAVGLGVMLTSQNPIDVDYSVISNAGIWWLGRLATRQDQKRVLEGLPPEESDALEKALGGLQERQFAVRRAGKSAWVMRTRDVISHLRGPMTLAEIENLGQASAPAAAAAAEPEPPEDPWLEQMPLTPEGYPVRWLDPAVAHAARFAEIVGDPTERHRDDGKTIWQPALYSRVVMRFDERDFVSEKAEDRLFFPISRHGGFAGFPGFEDGDLMTREPVPSVYGPIPDYTDERSELEALEKRITEALLAGETEHMYQHRGLRLKSRGGETMTDFRRRVRDELDAKADAEIAKLKDRVDRSLERLEERHRKYSRDKDRLEADAQARVGQELMNAGEMVYGMFFGRSRKTLSGAMSKRDQTRRAQARVVETEAKLTDLEREIYELEVDTEQQIDEIRSKWAKQVDEIETTEVRLEKNDVRLTDFGIVWIPVSRDI